MNVEKLRAKTVTVQAGKMNAVAFDVPFRKVMVKNFGTNDIWISVANDATKTEGSVRIPPECAQAVVLSVGIGGYCGPVTAVYITADAETSGVEVQPMEY